MSTKPPRVPPFNTGKVKIGLRYEPPRRWEPSRTAYDLQTALLAHEPISPFRRLSRRLLALLWPFHRGQ